MKILSIDTSGANCSVAIIDDQKILANFSINNGTTHSQNLVPMVEQAQKFANVELSDIDGFACSIGPGSFTGLRIGIATVKGFAMAMNKPVLSVPTLLGLAYNVSNFDGIICSIIDAKNDNVYSGIYRDIALYGDTSTHRLELIDEYVSDNIEVLINKLKDYEGDIIFVGDGVDTYKDILLENLQNDSTNIIFAPSHLNNQSALSVARAALDMASRNEFSDYNSLSPLYLKKSQAERELDSKQNKP